MVPRVSPIMIVRSALPLLLFAWGGCSGTSAKPALPKPVHVFHSGAPAATTRAAPTPAREPAPAPAHAVGGPGWLGVELASRDGGQAGVLIRAVLRGSPAERAGLVDGDVVLSIDGENLARPQQLREHVVASQAGTRISLGVLRGAETRLMAVELERAPSDDELMRKNYVGARAPDFASLDAIQGSITSLPPLRGRVVVLEFWASWCAVCRVMAPTLNGWHDRYSAQGLTVLGVTSDAIDVASRTAGELGIDYPLASDTTGATLRAYRANALPMLFVIDKQGNVRDMLIGFSTPRLREIEALMRKLIAEA